MIFGLFDPIIRIDITMVDKSIMADDIHIYIYIYVFYNFEENSQNIGKSILFMLGSSLMECSWSFLSITLGVQSW